jgi:hypothetical protein
MNRLKMSFAALVAALMASNAPAAITYTFDGGTAAMGYASAYFSLTVPTYITTNTTFDASVFSYCSGGGATFSGFPVGTCTGISFKPQTPEGNASFTLFSTRGNSTVTFLSPTALTQNGRMSGSTLPNYASETTLTVYGVAEVAAVPEPAIWALFIGGFGAIGATMRRRKLATA